MIAVNEVWCDGCGEKMPDGADGWHLNLTIPFVDPAVWPAVAYEGDDYALLHAPGDLCPECLARLRAAVVGLFAAGAAKRIEEAPKVKAERERSRLARAAFMEPKGVHDA